MPSVEQHINILNEKIEEFREEKKNLYSILLHNNYMASCKYIIGDGLPTVINNALRNNMDTYFNEVMKGFCLAHNIENQAFVDCYYLQKLVRSNDFYELDYLPNFQKILNLRYKIVFDAWTKELKWNDEIINNHQKRLAIMINTAEWAIPVSKIPENSLLEIFDDNPNEWSSNNLVKVEALIIKKVCKKLVKIEPIFGHFYNLGSKQLKFNSFSDLNDYLLNADHYKLFKIGSDGDKIGQYKQDEDGDIFLE